MKTTPVIAISAIALVVGILLSGTFGLIHAAPPSNTTLGQDRLILADGYALKPAETSTPNSMIRPSIPTRPIRPPLVTGTGPLVRPLPPDLAPANFTRLRAVVTVGPIDPPGNSWTNAQIADMEKAALALERHGVTVSRFYHPNANWDQIKAAAEGAHFFFYKGHGVYWSPMPAPTVGGFSLSDGIVSPDTIRSELHLTPGAIVMLYGCFTAGSAGNDTSPISSAEAQRRVTLYADPFVDMGVGAYFANIWDESFESYVDASFAGQTMGEVFKSFWAFNDSTFESYPYAGKTGYQLWLDPWSDPTFPARWNQAFVGDPVVTMTSLMTPPVLQLDRDKLTFLSLPEDDPDEQFVHVSNSGWWGHWFSWTTTVTSSGWLSVAPPSAMLPSSLITVTVHTTGLVTGAFDGQITVTAPQAGGSPKSIPVRLVIADHLYKTYLPVLHKAQ